MRYDIPLNGLLLSTVVCCLLGVIYFGSTAAFNAFTGVATLTLSASYGLPVLILLLRRRDLVKDAPYSLGKFGYFINLVTVCWIALAIVLFCMPTAIPVTAVTMSISLVQNYANIDYASVVFAGFTAISAVWYFVWGRKNFVGPVMHVTGPDGEIKEVDAKPINGFDGSRPPSDGTAT
jgi:amino acid transporter